MDTDDRIRYVLEQFKHMGATRDELKYEREKLQKNEEYLDEWCVTTGLWK